LDGIHSPKELRLLAIDNYSAKSTVLIFDSGLGSFGDVIFEDFKVTTMKNTVLWDIKPYFILHRRHISSPLQSLAC
jgi:hypothetical protein